MKTWARQIEDWKNGIALEIPSYLTKDNANGFYYRTSCCDKDMKNPYQAIFQKTTGLPKHQDISKIQKYLDFPKSKYATSFSTRHAGTIVVFPLPRCGKNFAHLRLFQKNASKKQQQEFWKYVAFRDSFEIVIQGTESYLELSGGIGIMLE
jgi:hypothetical protein